MSDNEIREALLAEPLVKSDREPDAVSDRAARGVETTAPLSRSKRCACSGTLGANDEPV
jgi:hypothetical protein